MTDVETQPRSRHQGELEAAHLIRTNENIVVYTGAGMSADSGVPTFRGSTAGAIKPEHLTAEVLADRPDQLLASVEAMRASITGAEPHSGHHAIADGSRTRDSMGGWMRVFTTNVDQLHERAGQELVYPLHGDLFTDRCTEIGCGFKAPSGHLSACGRCTGPMRPDVVLYGESEAFDASHNLKRSLRDASLLLLVGVSGSTMGVSRMVRTAQRDYQIPRVLWTLDPDPDFAAMFDVVVSAPASELPGDLGYNPSLPSPTPSSSAKGSGSRRSLLRSARSILG